jgi:hypothetical protein
MSYTQQATIGLFDQIFFGGVQSKVTEPLSPAMAFAAISLAAKACDGY